jgi:PRTRC genetic system protein B
MDLMNLANLPPMSADETAALLFICGDQYLFRYRKKDGSLAYKFVSSASVRAAFAAEMIDTNWLPSNVRRWGMGKRGEWIVIAYPAQRHRFTFEQAGAEARTLTLDVPMPPLAFFGYGQRYYLWAFKDAELKGDSNLFAAPLPNIDANGAICFGSNVVPKASAQTIAEAWRIFLTSPFTNHSVNGKSRKYPDDVRKQLMRLVGEPALSNPEQKPALSSSQGRRAKGRHRRYPIEDLVSLNRTINTVIDWILSVRGIE